MTRQKKLTIGILLILTIILAAAAVVVSLQLRQRDTSVSSEGCPDTSWTRHNCPSPNVGKFVCTQQNLDENGIFNLCAQQHGGGSCPFPNTTLQNGAQCNPACGGNACDGDGPLNCVACTCNGQTANVCLSDANACTQYCAGGGIGDGGGDGVVSPGTGAFSCTPDRRCTLSKGTFFEGQLNCDVQSGYVHYCEFGFANGTCITANPETIGTALQGGTEVNINQYLNKGCGFYQVDFQPPSYPNYSGACGAIKYVLTGENCEPTDGEGSTGPGGGSGDGSLNGLKIEGRVMCTDPNQTPIPMQGVRVRAEYVQDGQTVTFNAETNANGRYRFPIDLGNRAGDRFNVYIIRLPEDGTLPNGKSYSTLTGPRAINCDTSNISCTNSQNPSGNFCNVTNSTDSDRYTSCRLEAAAYDPTYAGFRFDFTNCGIPTPRCGDAVCDSGEICESTSADATTYKLCSNNQPISAVCRGINDDNTPACTFCGDGIVQTSAGEECDPNAPGETSATCNAQCRRSTSTPRCGDAICATGELCESTTPDGNTYKACSPNSSSTPITVCRGLGGNSQSPQCTYCGDGVVQTGAGEQCDPRASGTDGENCSLTCQRVTAACTSLTRTGPNPIQNGVGNTQQYTAVYQNASTTNPYPNMKLVVGTSGTPVGRDYNSQQNALVSPSTATFDSTQNTWTYTFVWEAATTSGADIQTPPTTYPVQLLPDGTNAESAAACTSTVELSETAQQEPLFTIVKEATPVCLSDNSAQISYRIRVQNIGPVSGVIDVVEDILDPRLVAANITPTAINPNFGVYSNGRIRWEGTEAQRTFAAGETKEYTFMVTIPANQVNSFAGTSLVNDVQVTYDTPTQQDNSSSFTVRTPITCSIITPPTTPGTGLFDDGSRYILIAMLLIITALIVYKYGVGSAWSKQLLERVFYSSPIATFEQKLDKDVTDKIEDENR